METREEIAALRLDDPEITAAEMSRRLNVSTQRIRQILIALGLPTSTSRSRMEPFRRPDVAVSLERCGNTVARGTWAELVAAADLVRRGYEVFLQRSGGSSCDMISLKEGKCERVEVKLGTWGSSKWRSSAYRGTGRHDRFVIVGTDNSVNYEPPLDEGET